MTPEDRQAFGVTEEGERALFDWIQVRTGSVLGADGRGGTGTFIELKDGRIALLTARHVVFRCMSTGEMTVARLSQARGWSVAPAVVRVDSSRDAALLFFEEGALPGEAVTYPLSATDDAEIVRRMPIIVSGVVGEWKQLDIPTRTIPLTKWLNLWTSVTEPRGLDSAGQEYVVCDVDETHPDLPASFKGMSGGSAFSLEHRLLGVITGEIRRKRGGETGELFVTRLSDVEGLFRDYVPPIDAPKDYLRREIKCAVKVKCEGQPLTLLIHADLHWSPTAAEGPDGRIGRIISVAVCSPDGRESCSVHVGSSFFWTDDDESAETHTMAVREELASLLPTFGFEIL